MPPANDVTVAPLPAQPDEMLPIEPAVKDEPVSSSTLLRLANEGNAGFVLEFGGQGADYLSELASLYEKHPIAKDFIDKAAAVLAAESTTDEALETGLHSKQKLDILSWINDPSSPYAPAEEYLFQAHVNYPLIGLVQLTNYLVTLSSLGIKHEDLLKVVKAGTGHSQGIASAVCCALSANQDEWTNNAILFIRYLFWTGLRCQQVAAHSAEVGPWETPTPMLAVVGLSREHLEKTIAAVNKQLSLASDQALAVGLVNGRKAIIVCGHPDHLATLNSALESKRATPGEDQTRIPFTKRKPEVSTTFIRSSVPFHSHFVSAAADLIAEDADRIGLQLSVSSLQFPIFSCTDGSLLSSSKTHTEALRALIAIQNISPVDWPSTIAAIATKVKGATHILDFGPATGATGLSSRLSEGTGVRIVLSSATIKPNSKTRVLGYDTLLKNFDEMSPAVLQEKLFEPEWSAEFSPKLMKREKDGSVIVDTKFSRTLGKAPIMIAGMTPTTSFNGIDLVAAAGNGGYHAELACGGLAIPPFFTNKLRELQSKQRPGVGINLNMIYINPYLMGFQWPMMLDMKRAGVPIESVTIAAGVPTPEKASEMLQELESVGIEVVAFKPGSAAAILAVLDIAKSYPSINVLLQWTGGRGGGHHSFEDFHEPLLATYAAIRRVKNVILVAGSGFGDATHSFPYLTGEWSEKLGYPKMPCDCILVGSRVMVAKEAATALAVKKMLVAASGVEDEKTWEKSYEEVAGGVMTVKSELGEPIHKVANRGMHCWRDFDRKYFSLPLAQREKVILKDKDEIIRRLNADFQKPFFGKKEDGRSADLIELSYVEVLSRLIEIFYVLPKTEAGVEKAGRWLDPTFKGRVISFATRTIERFGGASPDISCIDLLHAKPLEFLSTLKQRYPQTSTALLSQEDVDYFLHMCKVAGKPVNFIPVVDGELEYWFKRDSLWFSEDLDGAPGADAERVCILQGPVAVRFSSKLNEPVCDILTGMHEGYVNLLESNSQSDKSALVSVVPRFKALKVESVASSPPSAYTVDVNPATGVAVLEVLAEASSLKSREWLNILASYAGTSSNNWLQCFLLSDVVVTGSKDWIASSFSRVFAPVAGQKIKISSSVDTGLPSGLQVIEGNRVVVEVSSKNESSGQIAILLEVRDFAPATREVPARTIPLQLQFVYVPEASGASIHSLSGSHIESVKDFYANYWLLDEQQRPILDRSKLSLHDTVRSTFTVSQADVESYNETILSKSSHAALDFTTVTGWRSLMQPLFAQELQGDLLQLVHLSQSYQFLGSTADTRQPVQAGEVISTESHVQSVYNMESGKEVTVVAKLSRSSQSGVAAESLPFLEITAKFFIRGSYKDSQHTFLQRQTSHEIVITSAESLAVLENQEWFARDPAHALNVNDRLLFLLTTSTSDHSNPKGIGELTVKGDVFLLLNNGVQEEVGTIQYTGRLVKQNVVEVLLDDLQAKSNAAKSVSTSESTEGGFNILKTPLNLRVPEDASAYAVASRDLNPIHRSSYIAAVANLPDNQPIMHGMWTAAAARHQLIQLVCEGKEEKLSSYSVTFENMVGLGDNLYVQFRQTAASQAASSGLRVINVEVVNEKGSRVVSARAEVDLPTTAFVFTGQGSAEVGMGMDAYARSRVAKAIWDEGDSHLMKTFGFSILDIVRRNPKTLTVYFGGARGKAVRKNYMNLKTESLNGEGLVPLIPEITEDTRSFTFNAPTGLLFATQFSQPALVLFEKAAYAELKVAGLIPEGSVFAGHSLGEYACLASVAEVLSIPDLIETVFLRGLVMQKAVKRDASGRSEFAMVALNPSRCNLSEELMFGLVDAIAKHSNRLLQVVNFNVRGKQYVVAGELRNLDAISTVCNQMRKQGIPPQATPAEIRAAAAKLVAEALASTEAKFAESRAKNEPFTLTRGTATIPLPGIDVPFHSKQLLSGVPAFRGFLSTKLKQDVVANNLSQLIGKYIPNLIAKPFALNREFAEEIYSLTNSTLIGELLKRWESVHIPELAHTLVVELLAYQFASPVQWIATQDLMFGLKAQNVTRVVEIGPAPTLTNMAQRTLQSGEFGRAPRETLWVQRDRDVLFYVSEDQGPDASTYAITLAGELQASTDAAEAAQAPVAVEPVRAAPAPVVARPPPMPSAGSSDVVSDAPVAAKEVLRVLLAHKFKKPLSEIRDDSTIKALSAGKSALQNEVVGDLEKEFGSTPEGGAELTVSQLAGKFQGYNSLGKTSTTLVNKLLASKMPGGFGASSVRTYLGEDRRLGPGRTDGVLVHSLLYSPETRLANQGEATAWLDKVVESYAAAAGITIPKAGETMSAGFGGLPFMMAPMGGAPSGPAPVPDAPISSKEALKVLLAVKFKKPLTEIKEDSTVKALSAGKSAMQNEVVGDLEKEFGSPPAGGEEMPLAQLAASFSGYSSLGKVSSGLINKLLSSKMPGGFGSTQVKAYLQDTFALGPQRTDGVLLHSLLYEPETRLATEQAAKGWLDNVVNSYSSAVGVSVSKGGSGGAPGGGMMMGGNALAALLGGAGAGAGNSTTDKALRELFGGQVEVLQRFLAEDPLKPTKQLQQEGELRQELEQRLQTWVTEHGEFYESCIQPAFDKKKVRMYDSYWNWVMQDALELHNAVALSSSSEDESSSLSASAINSDRSAHKRAMSSWINATEDVLKTMNGPQVWFKPFLCNRATKELLHATEFYAKQATLRGHADLGQAIGLLAEEVEKWLGKHPVCLQVLESTEPNVEIKEDGTLIYSEKPREGIKDTYDYIKEMARGLNYNDEMSSNPVTTDASSSALVRGLETATLDASDEDDHDEKADVFDSQKDGAISDSGKLRRPRTESAGPKFEKLRESLARGGKLTKTGKAANVDKALKELPLPYIHIRKPSSVDPTIRLFHEESSVTFFSCLHDIATAGVTFEGKVALVTGCGRDSIGAEIVKGFLEGGAHVIVTTSSFSKKTTDYFREIYETYGSRGSKLSVFPFNQASQQDIQALINHIYGELQLDVDFVVPFAAISEVGRTISDIDSRSEAAHRLMLTNTIRLLGAVQQQKQNRGIFTRPAQCILPLSPNHGIFGGDGLYPESKLGIESLLNRWSSEGWQDFLSITGAVIGWTRGTGLMAGNNMVAPGVEKLGMRTFSKAEMAFNLIGLLHPRMVSLAEDGPVWADLTGGFASMHNLNEVTAKLRQEIMAKSAVVKAVHAQKSKGSVPAAPKPTATRRANPERLSTKFPKLPSKAQRQQLSYLKDMLDLEKVVVVAGFGEVGPWGNSRTRWEIESYGEFSIEGCLELAWITGLIKYQNGKVAVNGQQQHYIGWVDAKTNQPVSDHEIKAKYEEHILKHSGIRIIEPELFDGYNPHQKMALHQVALDRDMAPIECSDRAEAEEYLAELGDAVADIYQREADGVWLIKLKKGAVISVPRALKFDRFVAGQIPTGWDAERLGVPSDIASAVDPVTLYTLVSTVEALVNAGVTDPYEFYQYVHVSEVGNTSGGGMGGMRSLRRIYRDRLLEKPIAGDTLQECFINTMPAWINMLLLSSSGPIKTPVGACATAAESVEVGVETIHSGKARVVIVGGYDGFHEEGSYEFAQMKATSNSVEETAMGREPKEMCRPASDTRAGFMESHGAGIQLLMDAKLALEMGVPIYAIIGLTNTATDKNGRSVPAPGQGILTTAREDQRNIPSLLLDARYRRRQLMRDLAAVSKWEEEEIDFVQSLRSSASLSDAEDFVLASAGTDADTSSTSSSSGAPEEYLESQLEFVRLTAEKKRNAARAMWGNEFYKKNPSIAPLRGALSVWGLTVDDIAVASFHGTGTKLNDKNESDVTQKQMKHLGRSQGNPLWVVCQKHLTGHPKGAAAAWMLNGLIQTMISGRIPGNRNLDNTASELRQFNLLAYPNRSIQTQGIKAGILKSFGFGQAGGEILIIHPDYLFGAIEEAAFDAYAEKRGARQVKAHVYMQKVFTGKHSFVQVKDSAPYSSAEESSVYLNPNARATFDKDLGSWRFGARKAASTSLSTKVVGGSPKLSAVDASASSVAPLRQQENSLRTAIQTGAEGLRNSDDKGIGIDIEPVATFSTFQAKQDFIARNFTAAEIAYCTSAPHAAASFAGRWAAKEAVIKAISNAVPDHEPVWKGSAAPLKDIEIIRSHSGAPVVVLNGPAKEVAARLGIREVKISISHSDEFAIAQATAI